MPQIVRYPTKTWPEELTDREAEFEGDEFGAAGRLLLTGAIVEAPRRGRPGLIRAVLAMMAIIALAALAWHEIPLL